MLTGDSFRRLAAAVVWLGLICTAGHGQAPQGEQRMRLPPEEIRLQFLAGKGVAEVPFEVESDLMVIPVSVNGSRPLRFVLDTGAQGAVLNDPALTDSLRLNVVGKVRVRGAGSEPPAEASLAENVTFNVGGIEMSGGRLVVRPARPGATFMAGLDGVVGRSVFANLVVEVDWEKRVVRFYDPAKYTYSGAGATLPLTFDDGGRPYTTASVVVAGDASVPVKLVVDTGASHALSLDVGSHAGIRLPEGAAQAVLGMGASGEIRGHRGRVKSFQFAGHMLKDVPTSFPDESANTAGLGGRQGNLGAGVLKRFKVIYDYSRSRMIVEPNKFVNEPFGVALPSAAANVAAPTTAALQDFVGRYGNKEISVRDGGLYYQRIGGRGAALRPAGKDKFLLNTDAQITFLRDGKGVVTEMLIEWVERDKERLSRESPSGSNQPRSQ